jgi:hypothetical protein
MTKNAKRRANLSRTSLTTTFLDFLGGSFIKDRSLVSAKASESSEESSHQFQKLTLFQVESVSEQSENVRTLSNRIGNAGLCASKALP